MRIIFNETHDTPIASIECGADFPMEYPNPENPDTNMVSDNTQPYMLITISKNKSCPSEHRELYLQLINLCKGHHINNFISDSDECQLELIDRASICAAISTLFNIPSLSLSAEQNNELIKLESHALLGLELQIACQHGIDALTNRIADISHIFSPTLFNTHTPHEMMAMAQTFMQALGTAKNLLLRNHEEVARNALQSAFRPVLEFWVPEVEVTTVEHCLAEEVRRITANVLKKLNDLYDISHPTNTSDITDSSEHDGLSSDPIEFDVDQNITSSPPRA